MFKYWKKKHCTNVLTVQNNCSKKTAGKLFKIGLSRIYTITNSTMWTSNELGNWDSKPYFSLKQYTDIKTERQFVKSFVETHMAEP